MKKILDWFIIQWYELCWNTFEFRYNIKEKFLKFYYGNKLKFFNDFDIDELYYDKLTFDDFDKEYRAGYILSCDGEMVAIQLDNKFTNIFVEKWGGFLHNGKFDDYRISYKKLKKLSKKYDIVIYWAGN
jgi:hypothetical protein